MSTTNNMKQKLFVLLIGFFCLMIAWVTSTQAAGSEDSQCAKVKIEIRQELTLERQAFDAHMRINNGLSNIDLENLNVEILFTDEEGASVVATTDTNATTDPDDPEFCFFIRGDSNNVGSISGGSWPLDPVTASTSSDFHWLIIPVPGSAGDDPEGKLYFVGAKLTYKMGANGEEHVVDVKPDSIFVKPLPELTLDSFLTRQVYGDDPFTGTPESPVIEPSIPFTLGVRVKNTGNNTAYNLKIDSAQPKIVSNDQDLLVSFSIIGTEVNGAVTDNSLMVDLGNIAPGEAAVGRWLMISSLMGEFTEFTASVSHAEALGGQVTSIIDGITAMSLEKDVLVDLPGRDGCKDFLVKSFEEPYSVIKVCESEAVAGIWDSDVTDLSSDASVSFTNPSGDEATYKLQFTSSSPFIFVSVPDPFEEGKMITEAVRSDGKRIKSDNIWLYKEKVENEWAYFVNLFDVDSTGDYTVMFDTPVVNDSPDFVELDEQTGVEGDLLEFAVTATDPEGETLTLSASNLPEGADFIDNGDGTGTFNWTPAIGQAGDYAPVFRASDGHTTVVMIVPVEIRSINDTDGDGMDDDWEKEYFNDSLERDGTGDFDSDGILDLDEYLNGTDPTREDYGPSPPVIVSPAEGQDVTVFSPVLTIDNSTDPDGDTLTYDFEVFSDLQLTDRVAAAHGVAEGVDTTVWPVTVPLDDNTLYYWRVRSCDYAASSIWTYGTFFVDTANEAPGVFNISRPVVGSYVDTMTPVLEVTNSSDIDQDALTYRFEVYSDSIMTSQVTSVSDILTGTDGTTAWTVDVDLSDETTYYWKSVAVDPDGLETSTTGSFTVSTANQAPSAPAIDAPAVGARVIVHQLDIVVTNAVDPEGNTLVYDFQLDTVNTFDSSTLVTAADISEGTASTAWYVTGLFSNTTYFWRARAFDGAAYSPWVTGNFLVNPINQAPQTPTLNNPGHTAWVQSLTPELAVNPAIDPDGDVLSYYFELYSDSEFEDLVFEGSSAQPSFVVPSVLDDNTRYFWRALAEDPDGEVSEWMDGAPFFVREYSWVGTSPEITLAEPADDVFAADTFTIQWEDSDGDSNATIELYYDDDNTGENGTRINLEDIFEDPDGDTEDAYEWDISDPALLGGTWYIYAIISDETESLTVYADGSVTIGTVVGTENNDTLDGTHAVDDVIYGLGGNDTIVGYAGADTLYGGDGDDLMYGGVNDDTLIGGAGNDYMQGNLDNDTYLFAPGFGQDSISETADGGGTDIIEFTAGILPSDIVLTRSGAHLLIEVSGTDTITVAEFFGDEPNYHVEEIQFAEGTSWTREYVLSLLGPLGITLLEPSQDVYVSDTVTIQWEDSDPDNNAFIALYFDDDNTGEDGTLIVNGIAAEPDGDDDTYEWDVSGLSNGIWYIYATISDGTESLTDYANGAVIAGAMYGSEGDDALTGDATDNVMIGLGGNDTLDGSGGNDTLIGGADNDTLIGRTGNDTYVFDPGFDQDLINETSSGNGTDVIEFTAGILPADVLLSRDVDDLIIFIDGTTDQITVNEEFDSDADYRVEEIHFSDGTVWTYDDVKTMLLSGAATEGNDVIRGYHDEDDVIDGLGGNDTIYGYIGDDTLYGGAGNDTLDGNSGNDILIGGADNDTLIGRTGNDTYLFDSGFGQDLINETSSGNGTDVIEFTAGILPADVLLSRDVDDLIIFIDGTTDQITVNEEFDNDADYRVEEIHFSDGTAWTYDDVKTMLLSGAATEGNDEIRGYHDEDDVIDGLGGNDSIYGYTGDDTLYGGAGNDTLDGNSGNDTLIGGADNDTLIGRTGNDTYLFDPGFGQDLINETSSGNGTDVIEFTAGILPADVSLIRNGNDLIISIDGTTDQITVYKNFDSDADYHIELIRFAGGTEWTRDDMQSRLPLTGTEGDDLLQGYNDQDDVIDGLGGNDTIYGYTGDDTLYGSAGNDTLDGNGGNDTLIGGADNDTLIGRTGNDTYVFDPGFGQDLINETSSGNGTDVIEFTAGILPADVLLSRDVDDLIIFIDGTTDQITVNEEFDNDADYRVEEIHFSDGTAWTYDEIKTMLLSVAATEGDDEIRGYHDEDDVIDGLGGNDSIYGYTGDDTLYGGAGNDTLDGNSGNDTLIGGADNDTLIGRTGNDTYLFDPGFGQDLINETSSGNGTDVIEFTAGILPADVSLIRNGNDLIISIDGTTDQITVYKNFDSDADYHIELIRFAGGTEWTRDDMQSRLPLTGTEGDDLLQGYNDQDDVIDGLGGNDTIYGYTGDDTLYGSAGNDTLDGNGGNDTLIGGADNDTLIGRTGNDTYVFDPGFGQDLINETSSGNGTDVIEFTAGILPADVSLSRDVDDLIIFIDGTTDQITVNEEFDNDADYRVEEIHFSDGTAWTYDDVKTMLLSGAATEGNDVIRGYHDEDDVIDGLGGNDSIYGYTGDDTLYGGAGNDTLDGNSGNDTLIGGADNDTLIGRTGNDTYLFDPGFGQDLINETSSGNGTDVIEFTAGILPADVSLSRDVDDLIIFIDGTTDQITVNEEFDNDADYRVEEIHFSDGTAWTYDEIKTMLLSVAATEGDDEIRGYHDEDDVIDGLGGNDSIYGYTGDDTLYGGAGNDTLDGNSGNDTLIGGADNDTLIGRTGNDTYLFDPGFGQDLINETSSGNGTDVIEFTAGILPADVSLIRNGNDLIIFIDGTTDQITVYKNFDSDADYHIELIRFAGGTEWARDDMQSRLPVTGTEGDDLLQGYNDQDDVIDGLGGNDTIYGYTGDDTLYGGAGNDTLYGDIGNDTLDGGDGNDTLDGYTGDDTLYGGAGDDNLHGGDGYGNDILEGGPGNDFLQGYNGNDTYRFSLGCGLDTVDETGAYGGADTIVFTSDVAEADVILSRSADGTDLIIRISVDDVITVVDNFGVEGCQIEYIQFLDGQGAVLTTWGCLDVIGMLPPVATEGDDTLHGFYDTDDNIDGLGGNDVLYGYAGNDTLIGGDGNDTLDGDAGDDTLYGDAGADTLYGDIGNDTLDGGDGNDTLDGYTGDDTLYGGTGDDNLHGGDGYGNDILEGGPGNDLLQGYNGDDTYRFSLGCGLDTITEDGVSGGTDTIVFTSNVAEANVILSRSADGMDLIIRISVDDVITVTNNFGLYESWYIEYIEFLDAQGDVVTTWDRLDVIGMLPPAATDGDDTLYGDEYDNNIDGLGGNDVLYGYAGNDTLDGGDGADTLDGGAGNDTLNGGAGNDTLYGDIGNDTLNGGDGNDTLDGYTGDDTLYGGTGDDNLHGGDGYGNDILEGGPGNDLLQGYNGDDTYRFSLGCGLDTVDETGAYGGADAIVFTSDVAEADVILSRSADGMDLIIRISVDDVITVVNNFGVEGCQIEHIQFLDGQGAVLTTWGCLDVVGMLPPVVTEGDDTLHGFYDTDDNIDGLGGNDVLYGYAGNDTLIGGDGNDTLDGDAGDDTLYGDAGADTLYGDIGNDTLDGGDGNDTLDGYTGDDTLYGGAGDDNLHGGDGYGNDILEGGPGNDLLKGYNGNDTYRFSLGCGLDTITEDGVSGGTDTIVFTSDVAEANVILSRSADGTDLIIRISADDVITVTDNFGLNESYFIEYIEFLDAQGDVVTTWTWSDTQTMSEDDDGDGLSNMLEDRGCTEFDDFDTDDDGLWDGDEDINLNGTVDSTETDPCDDDSDNDGLPDGEEINTYGTDPTIWDNPNNVDLTYGLTVSASSEYNSLKENAFDDDVNTSWSPNNYPVADNEWISIDFGASQYAVDIIRIKGYGGTADPGTFIVQGSNIASPGVAKDSSDWLTLTTEDQTYSCDGCWDAYAFDNETAYRHVRIWFVSGGDAGQEMIIEEIEMFGEEVTP